MKKLIALLACCFAINSSLFAYNNLLVSNPHKNGAPTTGTITDAMVEVTPLGAFAEVTMTFSINAASSYNVKDSLEAVLKFDLPSNSFIHDSWLWLDNTTIIVADMIEKNRAIAIYEGIVKRRRDPSLLLKTGANSYQLNVYPMTTAYPRKVKIVYSVPFNWQVNKVNIPLPTDLFFASATKPDIEVKVNATPTFTQPGFSDKAYNNFITGTSGMQHTLKINASAYASNERFYLTYKTSINNGVWMNTYPTGGNEGIYQLVVAPGAVSTPIGRNLAIIIDNDFSKPGVYSLSDVKELVKSFLLNHLNITDSFNLFYTTNGTTVQAFPSWQYADSGSIVNSIKLIAAATMSTSNYETLLKTGFAFCKTRPNAESILISQNTSLGQSQSAVDASFNGIKAHLGNFTNHIHVINNSTSKYYGAGILIGNELLYSKLTLASGGNHYKYEGYTSQYYSLDMPNILKELGALSGYHTSTYSVDLMPTNGFTYSQYTVNGYDRFSLSTPYVETGKYYGSLQPGINLDIKVLSPTGMVNHQQVINVIDNGGDNNKKGWTYNFIRSMQGASFVNEIIDSSIKNRVLCDYTAFLAVETGDTLKTNTNDNTVLKIEPNAAVNKVTCSPNPFVNTLTIEWNDEINSVEIYDMTGRSVFIHKVVKGEKSLVWNGKDNAGNALSQGMYIVILRSDTQPPVVIKTLKL